MEYINLIQKTIDYIDAHIEENLSVDTLASIAGFSTYHYYKIFSSFVHLSVILLEHGFCIDLVDSQKHV
jgi:AraC family transcriptional regulator